MCPGAGKPLDHKSEVARPMSCCHVLAYDWNKVQEDFKETLVKKIDAFADQLIGRNVILELFSLDIDPKTRAPKKSKEAVLKDWSQKANLKSEKVNYTSDILVESDFGVPGAITITNKHQKEFYLESITIEGFACGPVYFPCNSWVQSVNDHAEPRIFFSNQVIIVCLI
ncbi:linoleate 13S-lipoxygenase 3-1, chloroplastic [Tanacetum coccineum]